MFQGKTLLITGGTGSFGCAVVKRFIQSEIREIRIFSRDEKKQDEMRKAYNSSKLKFYIGDVRDYRSICSAVYGVDYIFHAAALKQVPSCEFYPVEAIKTNILGAQNVIDAAFNHHVKKVICLSTDKAVYPINAMGMSKALMEKIMVAKSRELLGSKTVVCATRYGNVMASRGSVIPLFLEQLRTGKPITVTESTMTRFMMNLNQAVELVLFAFRHGMNGDIFVQKAPAATIELIVRVLKKIVGRENHKIVSVGIRHGEKMHETLLTPEEMANAEDLQDYYRIPADVRDLNYSAFYEVGKKVISQLEGYHSSNTYQLNEEELEDILLNVQEIREDLINFGVELNERVVEAW